MPDTQLVLCEPSKVRNQHITLLDGLTRAHASLGRGALRFLAHPSLFAALTAPARAATDLQPISVMDPERRRLVRKSLLEAFTVARAIARLKAQQVLLVTCMLPSSLILIEGWKRLFSGKRVIVMLHGEIEGAFDERRQGPASYGFYVLRWLAMRTADSTLELAVIDEFIKRELLSRFPGKFDPAKVHIVPLPLLPVDAAGPSDEARFRACFVGFDTPDKGFSHFQALAAALPDIDFMAIGGGRVRNLHTGAEEQIADTASYMAAIANCDLAVFPYVGGYSCSLSAAVLDALSAGLHVLATERACFVGLAETLGADVVTLEADPARFVGHLGNPNWRAQVRRARAARRRRIARSRYSVSGVAAGLSGLIADVPENSVKAAVQEAAA